MKANNKNLFAYDGSYGIRNGWTHEWVDFIADGVNTEVSFVETGISDAEGSLIDNVHLTQVAPTGAQYSAIRGNSAYAIVSGSTWTEGSENAKYLGGTLVTISSQAENNFLVSRFNTIDPTTVYGRDYKAVWIGLSDAATEGYWQWSSGEPLTFTNWYPGCPNGDGNYADMVLANTTDAAARTAGDWNDAPNGGELYPYVRYGLAEFTVSSKVATSKAPKEGDGLFTTTIDIAAGSKSRTDLLEGQTIYWTASGFNATDLLSGSTAGQGQLSNGKITTTSSFRNNLESFGGLYEINIYSDQACTEKIGATFSTPIEYVDNGDATFSISGTQDVGQKLSAVRLAADPDGDGTFNYKWEVSESAGGWSAVGADSQEYTITSSDAGRQIRVTVSYKDKQGFDESVTAAAISIPNAAKLIGDGLINTDLIGTNANDRMSGKGVPTTGGQDIIDGKGGTNDIVFESGNYNYKISGTSTASTVVGSTTTKSGTRTVTTTYINDSITNVEGVEITGGASANTLDASTYSGRANLNGDAGADTLIGGTGPDVLTGGLGADIFKFVVKPSTLTAATADRITDFKSAESDKIQVSRSAFGIASTAKVTFTATSDITKGLATSSLFVLDSTTGYLYYNANGTAADAGTSGGVFAVLDKINGVAPALTASNIALV